MCAGDLNSGSYFDRKFFYQVNHLLIPKYMPLKFFFLLCIIVCVCVLGELCCVYVHVSPELLDPLRARVTGSCVLLSVGARNELPSTEMEVCSLHH